MTGRDDNVASVSDKPEQRASTRPVASLSSFAVMAAVALTACVSQPKLSAMTPITVLYESRNCGVLEPGMAVVQTTEQWDSLKTSLHRANPLGPAPVIAPIPDGDISLVVAWGQKPNGAYAMKLTATQAAADAGTLVLPIEFVEPAPGTFATQALVSPCFVISVPADGPFNRVSAGDLSVEL